MNTKPHPPFDTPKRLNFFERYLSLWVLGCMIVGVALGKLLPGFIASLSKLEFGQGSQVNIPIAVLIWLMIFPMMLKIDFGSLGGIAKKPKGLFITLFVNWLVKPFSMAFLAWVFLQHVFAGWVEPEMAKSYTAGLIILAAAPCTAMVFVWSYLTDGDPAYTLVQVASNDLLMLALYVPICGLLIGVSNIALPWDTLAVALALFIGAPLALAVVVRGPLDVTASGVKGTVERTQSGLLTRVPGFHGPAVSATFVPDPSSSFQ